MNIPITKDDGLTAWASDRAPSDCVAQAMPGFFEEKFDKMDLTAYNAIQGIGNWQLNVNHMITNQLPPVEQSLLEC